MGEFELLSSDGLRLSGFDWPSSESPHSPGGLLILLHGLAEHTGRYEEFAQFYNENNIAVISMDLRGHGLSEGAHVFIPNAETIFLDIDLLIAEARDRYPTCPAVLYGHSMGGNLALSYTLARYPHASNKCPYQAVIVTSPWIRLARYRQPVRPVFSLLRTVCGFHPALKVPLRFNSRILSRDREIVSAYDEDPHVRRSVTLSLCRTMGDMAVKLDRTSCAFDIPVLVQHGEADSLTSHRASAAFARRGSNIDYHGWPECYHELHNEPVKEKIFHFTLGWISAKLFHSVDLLCSSESLD